MKLDGPHLRLSASDLANHLGCRHLTSLDREVAERKRPKPDFFDPTLKTLQERGFAHEAAYLQSLRAQGLTVVDLGSGSRSGSVEDSKARTVEAMRSGADVIAQATLTSGRWLGYADILCRVALPSQLGAWSYEAHDTKLSRETKVGAVLQLALYSDILEELQGVRPEKMWVIAPGAPFSFDPLRFDDFRAYYRWVRRRLEATLSAPERASEGASEGASERARQATEPEPVPRCDSCHWARHCEAELRRVDHLSLVAGISRAQRRELLRHDVSTLAALAQAPLPWSWKPATGSKESLTRVREQARLQLEGRTRGAPTHELLPLAEHSGLALLPEPSPGDLFFDFEGDPFVDGGGLEYLFGYAFRASGAGAHGQLDYRALWALSRSDERRAFESFVDDLMARWAHHPAMHVYHFAPYEPAALKRLMGRHGTREQQVDQMLRGGLFVDLYRVVRQAVRASVESYSIKKLEPFFQYVRDVPLPEVGHSKRALEAALELASRGAAPEVEAEWQQVVQAYNRDDCLSAAKLRDWLEALRGEWIQQGQPVPRPAARQAEGSENQEEQREIVQQLAERLLEGIPVEAAQRTPEQRARVLMAALLDFHRREEKVTWWELYRLKELAADELADEPRAIAGLQLQGEVDNPKTEKGSKGKGGRKRLPIHRYSFPPQEVEADERDEAHGFGLEGKSNIGEVVAVDEKARTIDIKKTGNTAEVHPEAVLLHNFVRPKPLPQALFRLGEWIAAHGVDEVSSGASPSDDYRAARDLLLALPPRLKSGSAGLVAGSNETTVDHAIRLGLELDRGVLPIQGPPGAGKTYTGARMIAALVAEGKRVGVTAVSHAVVKKLLLEVQEAARQLKQEVRCARKVTEADEAAVVAELDDNKKALQALASGDVQVLGGTPWLWAAEEALGAADVLFIDEAGQLSLANALAVAGAASSLVLLGDPRQLEQPQKGTHPDGAEVSALEHLLGEHLTLPDDRGLFLAETRRLHPAIADFTSRTFYEGRLRSHPGLERQGIQAGPVTAPGLWFLPVEHTGNANKAPEEVAAVVQLVEQLLGGENPDGSAGGTWTNGKGQVQRLTPQEILVVAPYNAQVDALEAALAGFDGLRVGTVDKFQGQEAAVVILSMTSSSVDEAPRGMDFLFSPNRFNVATSRAKCACVLVASPALFEAECRSPKQMRLVNALCQYREGAKTLPPTGRAERP